MESQQCKTFENEKNNDSLSAESKDQEKEELQ